MYDAQLQPPDPETCNIRAMIETELTEQELNDLFDIVEITGTLPNGLRATVVLLDVEVHERDAAYWFATEYGTEALKTEVKGVVVV